MGEIIDVVEKVKNVKELAKYLDKVLNKSYMDGFDIIMMNKEGLTFLYKGEVYAVAFDYKQKAMLICDVDASNYKKIKNIISPLMWRHDKSEHSPVWYCGQLCSYIENSRRVVEWHTDRPLDRLRELAFDVYVKEVPLIDLKIDYPNTKLEDFKKDTYYGNFTGHLKDEYVEKYKTASEYELYSEIMRQSNKYEEVRHAGEVLNQDVWERLDMIDFTQSFLYRQTERFGVRSEMPDDLALEPTVEQMAWVNWWQDALQKIYKENPNIFKEWEENFEDGYDPSFRPEGDYSLFLEDAQKEYDTLVEERDLENAKVLDQMALDFGSIFGEVIAQEGEEPSDE